MRRWVNLIGILLLMGLIGGAGYLGYLNAQPEVATTPAAPVTVAVSRGLVQQTVTAPGQLVGTWEVILGMDVGGRLLDVNVRPGSMVRQGDTIARLDPTPFEAALALAQLRLAQAEDELAQRLAEAELATANSQAQVSGTQAQFPSLTAAEVNRQAAIEAAERAQIEYQKALDRPWEPPEVSERYRLEWEQAKDRQAIAQAEYEAVLNQRWAVGQQVAALETEVERANLAAEYLRSGGIDPLLSLAVDQAERDLAAAVLQAPFDGVVTEVWVKPGQAISAGSDLVLLVDPAQSEVRVTVIEEDLSLVQVGQATELFFDARPELAVGGTVSRIVPQRVAGEARPLYHVYIAPDESLPQGVVPGMTVDASIIIAQEEDVLRLPRALVRAKADGTAEVEVWRDGRRESRSIEVGLRGDVYITIQSGLRDGEQVVGE
jgi:multidrug efflux pump subunit AcrA (membrane-fusion protein)